MSALILRDRDFSFSLTSRCSITRPMKTNIRILGLFLVFTLSVSAANGPATGLDAQKLKEIPKRMQQFVEDKTISGAVTLVARHGQIAELDAIGLADLAEKKPMRPDSL